MTPDAITDALAQGWELRFGATHNPRLPIFCTARKLIDLLAPTIHRFAVASYAGTDPIQAMDRAILAAESAELTQIEYHSARAPADATRPDLSDLLAAIRPSAPTIPTAILRRF